MSRDSFSILFGVHFKSELQVESSWALNAPSLKNFKEQNFEKSIASICGCSCVVSLVALALII